MGKMLGNSVTDGDKAMGGLVVIIPELTSWERCDSHEKSGGQHSWTNKLVAFVCTPTGARRSASVRVKASLCFRLALLRSGTLWAIC